MKKALFIFVINYELWETTAFIQICGYRLDINASVSSLWSEKKVIYSVEQLPKCFCGLERLVFKQRKDAYSDKERKLLHEQHYIWLFDVYLVKPSCISVAHCSC